MRPETLDRAAGLLAGLPGHDLPIDHLRDAVDPGLAAYTLLRWLADDPRFVVSPTADPLEDVPIDCDDRTRELYRAALGSPATSAARVGLRDLASGTPRAPNTDAMRLVAASIRRLGSAADEPVLAHRIAEARAEYGAIARAARPAYPPRGR